MGNKQRILIVEDDIPTSIFLSLGLADEGFHVATANDGLKGLSLVQSFCPDLILLDMQLPILDGRHFISIYRECDRPAPIICISADSNARRLAIDLGIDFVEKPFELDELYKRIDVLLH